MLGDVGRGRERAVGVTDAAVNVTSSIQNAMPSEVNTKTDDFIV
jgi:hypothetical protein